MQPVLIRTLDNLRQALESFDGKSRYEEVATPIPGHQLILEKGDRQYVVEVWDLCFQVCFANYQPEPFVDNLPGNQNPLLVEIDQHLFSETGAVDWTRLDQKAQQCIQRMLTALAPDFRTN